MGDKRFPGESALEALFGAIKSSLSSKQNQTLSTTIAGSSTVEGALQALEQSYSGLDYDELDNKPQINGVELSGNKTASDLGITIPTNLSDLNDDSTHRLVTDAEKSAWNGKADTADITDAISALDVSSVGGTGKYISEISEADGKISATARVIDNIPIAGSPDPVKSGGIFNAINDSVSLKTAAGNPITLTDAAEAKVEDLSMTIEPIQSGSGDPSPTNVRPISGLTEGKVTRTGKNLLPLTVDGIKAVNTNGTWNGNVYTFNGVTFSIQTDDGNVIGIQANGTASGGHALFVLGGVSLRSSMTYKYNGNPSSGLSNNCRIDIYNSNSSYFQSVITANDFIVEPLKDESYYIRIAVLNGYTASNLLFKPMLRLSAETDPTFEPYTANTATITFGQTVYGGSVNFKTGEVTVTHKLTTVGALTWSTQVSSFANFMSTSLASEIKRSEVDEIAKSDIYVSTYNATPKPIPYSIYGNARGDIKVNDRRYSTVEEWLAVCASAQILYELETPVTLTLTPAELELLKGNNTITANGVEISIEYYPNNAVGALAGRVDDKADKEDVAVPKYDATNRREYYEGGSAFSGDIDSVPTAGSSNAVSSGGTKTYVDNAVDGVVKHVAGELSITIPLSDSWTVAIFGTISVTPISAILTVVSGGSVSVTDLTSNSLASRANISTNISDQTVTITSKNTDKFYVNIVY